MTSVRVITIDSDIRLIRSSGHSGYADTGSDIVCAAISALMTTFANALEKVVGIEPIVSKDEQTATLTVALPKKIPSNRYHDAQTVARTVLQGLRDISQTYPDNCHITIIDGRKTPC